MEILPIAFDSFSTRSMATLIKTDLNILIDPSIAIAPERYSLPPHELELKELEERINQIILLGKKADLIIITHYHWDHCPHPDAPHFNVLFNKKILLKDINKKINNSQRNRGLYVLKNLKEKAEIEFSDNKSFEFEKTYIKISEPVWHGEENTPLGFVNMIYIEYKNNSLLFASDIQGILNEDAFKIIVDLNPNILIMSGPAIYHARWKKKYTETSYNYILKIIENTKVSKIIIDHHLLRSLNYNKYLDKLREESSAFNVSILTAAEYLGIENRLLEARRKELYGIK